MDSGERGTGTDAVQSENEPVSGSGFPNTAPCNPPSLLWLNPILRTAEAALRRLIMLFIHVNHISATAQKQRTGNQPLPDFSSFNRVENALPLFSLIDPRKPILFVEDNVAAQENGRQDLETHEREQDERAHPVNPAKLLARLQALDHALHTLPRQAQRMAREIAKRQNAEPGPACVPPIRIGKPPGHRNRPKHEIDHVLKECHGLLKDVIASPP